MDNGPFYMIEIRSRRTRTIIHSRVVRFHSAIAEKKHAEILIQIGKRYLTDIFHKMDDPAGVAWISRITDFAMVTQGKTEPFITSQVETDIIKILYDNDVDDITVVS
jgi:hypothetical protein